jgi:hypothetical protein
VRPPGTLDFPFAIDDFSVIPPFDPLTARVSYAIEEVPESRDGQPFSRGWVVIDGQPVVSSEVLTPAARVVEKDLCFCGCPGCGTLDLHLHRSGPYLLFTCWERRRQRPDFRQPELPLVLAAASLEEPIGLRAADLPIADRRALTALFPVIPAPGARILWEDTPYQQSPEPLLALLQGPDFAWLEGAELIPPPADARLGILLTGEPVVDPMPLFGKGTSEGCVALRVGALARFPVYLRLPALPRPG